MWLCVCVCVCVKTNCGDGSLVDFVLCQTQNFETPCRHCSLLPAFDHGQSRTLFPVSLIVSYQKRDHRQPKNSRSNRQASQIGRTGPRSFSLGKWRPQNGGHQQKKHLDIKASCSESRLILIRVADLPLPLSECALYRQTEQERHFRWRGWMLRPRVIRSPTNPKWERSWVRVPLRAACSFCFLFCRLSLFF